MILYMVSKTIKEISFAVHQCDQFTHYTKASHDMDLKRICWYPQGTKYKGLLFNPYNKTVVYWYVDAYFSSLWVHDNPKYPIFSNIRTVFVVTFSKFYLMCVSKIQREISLSTIHSECVALHHYVRY